MSIRTECMHCKAKLIVLNEMLGKKVRCPKCEQMTTVTERAATVMAPAKANPDRSAQAVTKNPPPRPPRLPRDEDETRPAKASRRSRRDEDEDEDSDDRPRRGSKKTQKSNMPLILAGVGGGLGLLLVVVIVIVVMSGSSNDNKVVAKNNVRPQGEAARRIIPPKTAPDLLQQAAIPAGPLPAQIDPATVIKVKGATVQFRVKMSNGLVGEGSGFFGAEKGLVFTNAHVLGMKSAAGAAPSKIDIIINSGEKGEAVRRGKLLGVDRFNDLAVLNVEGNQSNLPDPLPVGTATNLTELQKVYVFGFPLGSGLGKNITVSESSVSSLRKTSERMLYQIQINGGITHGNSGGPVVDSRGVVIGVAVAIIEGTQLNFAIPADFVNGVLRGRVIGMAVGEAVRENSQVKVPIELTFLDPLNRLQDVQIEYWVGNHGPARLPSWQKPAPRLGDEQRETKVLTFKDNISKTEIELPKGNENQAFWIQPILKDKTGFKHWSTALAYKLSDFVPVERKPVLLKHQLESESVRTVKFATVTKRLLAKEGKALVQATNLEMQAVETAKKDPRGAQFDLYTVGAKIFLEEDGVRSKESPTQELSLLKSKFFSYTTNQSGGLLSRSQPRLSGNAKDSLVFDRLALIISNAYEIALVPLPNRTVKPKETWDAKVPFTDASSLAKRDLADMNIKCMLEGSRQYKGQEQGVISVSGHLTRRREPKKQAGKITGKLYFAVDKGYMAEVKLKCESEGFVDSDDYVEVVLTRTLGNSTGVTPPSLPTPKTPGPIAQGKIIVQTPNLNLGAGDPLNYPEKPGCFFKALTLQFQAGKTYTIQMNRADNSKLDPFLILLSPMGQKVAFDDDSGGNLNALITYRAPATGVYRLLATSMAPNMTGQFQVIVSELPGGAKMPNPNLPKKGKKLGVNTRPGAFQDLFQERLWKGTSPHRQPTRTAFDSRWLVAAASSRFDRHHA